MQLHCYLLILVSNIKGTLKNDRPRLFGGFLPFGYSCRLWLGMGLDVVSLEDLLLLKHCDWVGATRVNTG